MMSNFVIVDVQGFQYKTSDFFCKELAIVNNETSKHYFFNIHITKEVLSDQFLRQSRWLTKNLHGLSWITPYGENLTNLRSILNENIASTQTIYVKGLSKAVWLSKILPDNNIINVEELGCPKLSVLHQQTSTLYNNYHCDKHERQFQCALENAHIINHWLELI